ncbi:MAG: vWA domain-containing protein [Methylococcales bacterium]
MTDLCRDFGLLLLAGLLMLICLTRPTIPLARNTFHYLFILDITQSMNTRDYHATGLPADRLSFAKQALRRAIRDLPCGSKAGVGLFSTRNILLLIEPLEICSHFAAIDDTISRIDWRMAWSADSYIERGLYGGILATQSVAPRAQLVFMSDGEQNIRELHRPPLAKHRNTIKGFIFGVGGLIPSPIPKLDKDNSVVGFWAKAEVDEFSILTESLEPSAQKSSEEQPYLSSLHEPDLQVLAVMSGLDYHRLESPEQFSKILRTENFAQTRIVETDIRWVLALASGVLILLVYLLPIGFLCKR